MSLAPLLHLLGEVLDELIVKASDDLPQDTELIAIIPVSIRQPFNCRPGNIGDHAITRRPAGIHLVIVLQIMHLQPVQIGRRVNLFSLVI
jgi:hypothetical protein